MISNISDRQQIAQLLRARGTHAMFSSSNTPLSSSLPLSASSRTSSASSSPPLNSTSPSFWPDNAKSVSLYIAPRGRTRPSVSVEGLKVETFLRAAGVR